MFNKQNSSSSSNKKYTVKPFLMGDKINYKIQINIYKIKIELLRLHHNIQIIKEKLMFNILISKKFINSKNQKKNKI